MSVTAENGGRKRRMCDDDEMHLPLPVRSGMRLPGLSLLLTMWERFAAPAHLDSYV